MGKAYVEGRHVFKELLFKVLRELAENAMLRHATAVFAIQPSTEGILAGFKHSLRGSMMSELSGVAAR